MIDLNAIETHVLEVKQEYVHNVLDILGREDITQKDLADNAGVTPQHLVVDLYHNHNSTLRTLCRIAGALGYRVRISLEKVEQEAGK